MKLTSHLFKKMNIITRILLTIGLLFVSFQVISADDYLKQLELEATDDESELDQSAPTERQGSNKSKGTSKTPENNESIKLIVGVPSFEEALKNTYPESFNLYMEMDPKEKAGIYEHYKEHKRLYNSSVKIISVYLATH